MLKALEFIPSTEEKIKKKMKGKKEEGRRKEKEWGRVAAAVLERPRRGQGRKAFWTRLSQTARCAYKTKE